MPEVWISAQMTAGRQAFQSHAARIEASKVSTSMLRKSIGFLIFSLRNAPIPRQGTFEEAQIRLPAANVTVDEILAEKSVD